MRENAYSTDGLRWHTSVPRNELPKDGTGLTTEIAGQGVALFDVEDELFAIDDTCPHQGACLGMGVVLEGEVTCPWHGWHFDLETGLNTDGLASRVTVHPVRVDAEGRVQVALAGPAD